MVIGHRRPPTAAMQRRRSRAVSWPGPLAAQTSGFLSECSENPPQFRQRKSRIFTPFRSVASVFLKYWVSEQQASYYIGVEGGLDDQNPGREGR
jgi:hypothetical protein